MKDETSLFLKGRAAMVYPKRLNKNAEGDGFAIYDPYIAEVFGKRHLIGTIPHDLGDWTAGAKAWIALEEVAYLLEFATKEAMVEGILADTSKKRRRK